MENNQHYGKRFPFPKINKEKKKKELKKELEKKLKNLNEEIEKRIRKIDEEQLNIINKYNNVNTEISEELLNDFIKDTQTLKLRKGKLKEEIQIRNKLEGELYKINHPDGFSFGNYYYPGFYPGYYPDFYPDYYQGYYPEY